MVLSLQCGKILLSSRPLLQAQQVSSSLWDAIAVSSISSNSVLNQPCINQIHFFTATASAAVQEGSRTVRCQDSPLNSAIGGAATGALLFASHGASAPRGAVICSALGAAAHWSADKIQLDHSFRSLLIAWGLLDESAAPPKPLVAVEPSFTASTSPKIDLPEAAAVTDSESKRGLGLWQRMRPHFPIRKLTDEEWTVHLKKQAQAEEIARRAALEGVHPDTLLHSSASDSSLKKE